MEAENENGEKEDYFMLAHELPEDQNLREKLQKEKLVSELNEKLQDAGYDFLKFHVYRI